MKVLEISQELHAGIENRNGRRVTLNSVLSSHESTRIGQYQKLLAAKYKARDFGINGKSEREIKRKKEKEKERRRKRKKEMESLKSWLRKPVS